MKTWIEERKLSSLMYGLYGLIRVTSLRSSRFREKLREKDVVVVMASRDKSVSRTFRCQNGEVRSEKGWAFDAASRIIWVSAKVGSRVMLNVAKGNPKALMKAVMKGELIPEGDAAGIKWFLDVVSLLSKLYSGTIEKETA